MARKTQVKASRRRDGTLVQSHERRVPDGRGSPAQANADAASAAATACNADSGRGEMAKIERTTVGDLRVADLVPAEEMRWLTDKPSPFAGWVAVVDIARVDGRAEMTLSGVSAADGAPLVMPCGLPDSHTVERLRRPPNPNMYISDCANCEIEATQDWDPDSDEPDDVTSAEAAELVATGVLCPACANSLSICLVADHRGQASLIAHAELVRDLPWLDNGAFNVGDDALDAMGAELPQPPRAGTWQGAPLAAVPAAEITAGMLIADRENDGFAVVTGAEPADDGAMRIRVAGWDADNDSLYVSSYYCTSAAAPVGDAVKPPPYDRDYADWADTSCERCKTPARLVPPVRSAAEGIIMLRDGNLCAYCLNHIADTVTSAHSDELADADRL